VEETRRPLRKAQRFIGECRPSADDPPAQRGNLSFRRRGGGNPPARRVATPQEITRELPPTPQPPPAEPQRKAPTQMIGAYPTPPSRRGERRPDKGNDPSEMPLLKLFIIYMGMYGENMRQNKMFHMKHSGRGAADCFT